MVHVRIDRRKGVVVDDGNGCDIDRSANNFGFSPYAMMQSGSADQNSTVTATIPGFYLLRNAVGVTASLPGPGDVPGGMWVLTSNGATSNFFVTASNRGATGQFPFGTNGVTIGFSGSAAAQLKLGNNMTVTGSVTLISDGIRYVPIAVSGTHTFGV